MLGEVSDKRGPVSYDVKVNGQFWRRHAEQLLSHVNVSTPDSECTVEVGEEGSISNPTTDLDPP